MPLETEEARLSQQYQKLSGSLTVQFRGEEKTLVQMGRYLEETDRALRQEAWELVANRRLQEAEKFEAIFEQLVKLREQIARNAGYGELPRLRLPQAGPVRLHAGGLREVPCRRGDGDHAGPARAASRAAAAAWASRRCGPGIWRWTR